MSNQVRNTLIAGTVASLFLGPLGAVAVGAVASAMSQDQEEEITSKEFSVWNNDQLVGVVENEKIASVLTTMNNQKSMDFSGVRIGVRWSDDSVEYFNLKEATEAFV